MFFFCNRKGVSVGADGTYSVSGMGGAAAGSTQANDGGSAPKYTAKENQRLEKKLPETIRGKLQSKIEKKLKEDHR